MYCQSDYIKKEDKKKTSKIDSIYHVYIKNKVRIENQKKAPYNFT